MRHPSLPPRSLVQEAVDSANRAWLWAGVQEAHAYLGDRVGSILLNLNITGAQAPAPSDSDDCVERLVPYITFGGVAVVSIVWLVARWASAGRRKEASKEVQAADRQLAWLGTLAIASALLLAFQLALGLLSGSLTLIADMAHAAGDMVTYVAAYIAEKAKQDLSCRDAEPRTVASIDLVAGGVSTALVAITGVKAMMDATDRLRFPSGKPTDFQMVGPAILSFAVVTAGVNSALLALRFFDAPADDPEPEAASRPPPPPLPAVPASARLPPPPPPPLRSTGADADESMPPGPPAAPAVAGQRARPKGKGGQKWLHAAFHPGCSGADGDCAHGSAPADPSAAPAAAVLTETTKNLNVYGAALHLVTDVARSILVLVTGILLQLGVFTDAARTDAVCALLVGACIIIGSIVFLHSSVARIWACLCGPAATPTSPRPVAAQ